MFRSTVGNTFVGVAIATDTDYRFRTVDMKIEDLNESVWHVLDELRRAASHLFTTVRPSVTKAPSVATPLKSAVHSLSLVSIKETAQCME